MILLTSKEQSQTNNIIKTLLFYLQFLFVISLILTPVRAVNPRNRNYFIGDRNYLTDSDSDYAYQPIDFRKSPEPRELLLLNIAHCDENSLTQALTKQEIIKNIDVQLHEVPLDEVAPVLAWKQFMGVGRTFTLLYAAASCQNASQSMQTVNTLLVKGASPLKGAVFQYAYDYAPNAERLSAFTKAAIRGYLPIIEKMGSKINLKANTCYPELVTALYKIIEHQRRYEDYDMDRDYPNVVHYIINKMGIDISQNDVFPSLLENVVNNLVHMIAPYWANAWCIYFDDDRPGKQLHADLVASIRENIKIFDLLVNHGAKFSPLSKGYLLDSIDDALNKLTNNIENCSEIFYPKDYRWVMDEMNKMKIKIEGMRDAPVEELVEEMENSGSKIKFKQA